MDHFLAHLLLVFLSTVCMISGAPNDAPSHRDVLQHAVYIRPSVVQAGGSVEHAKRPKSGLLPAPAAVGVSAVDDSIHLDELSYTTYLKAALHDRAIEEEDDSDVKSGVGHRPLWNTNRSEDKIKCLLQRARDKLKDYVEENAPDFTIATSYLLNNAIRVMNDASYLIDDDEPCEKNGNPYRSPASPPITVTYYVCTTKPSEITQNTVTPTVISTPSCTVTTQTRCADTLTTNCPVRTKTICGEPSVSRPLYTMPVVSVVKPTIALIAPTTQLPLGDTPDPICRVTTQTRCPDTMTANCPVRTSTVCSRPGTTTSVIVVVPTITSIVSKPVKPTLGDIPDSYCKVTTQTRCPDTMTTNCPVRIKTICPTITTSTIDSIAPTMSSPIVTKPTKGVSPTEFDSTCKVTTQTRCPDTITTNCPVRVKTVCPGPSESTHAILPSVSTSSVTLTPTESVLADKFCTITTKTQCPDTIRSNCPVQTSTICYTLADVIHSTTTIISSTPIIAPSTVIAQPYCTVMTKTRCPDTMRSNCPVQTQTVCVHPSDIPTEAIATFNDLPLASNCKITTKTRCPDTLSINCPVKTTTVCSNQADIITIAPPKTASTAVPTLLDTIGASFPIGQQHCSVSTMTRCTNSMTTNCPVQIETICFSPTKVPIAIPIITPAIVAVQDGQCFVTTQTRCADTVTTNCPERTKTVCPPGETFSDIVQSTFNDVAISHTESPPQCSISTQFVCMGGLTTNCPYIQHTKCPTTSVVYSTTNAGPNQCYFSTEFIFCPDKVTTNCPYIRHEICNPSIAPTSSIEFIPYTTSKTITSSFTSVVMKPTIAKTPSTESMLPSTSSTKPIIAIPPSILSASSASSIPFNPSLSLMTLKPSTPTVPIIATLTHEQPTCSVITKTRCADTILTNCPVRLKTVCSTNVPSESKPLADPQPVAPSKVHSTRPNIVVEVTALPSSGRPSSIPTLPKPPKPSTEVNRPIMSGQQTEATLTPFPNRVAALAQRIDKIIEQIRLLIMKLRTDLQTGQLRSHYQYDAIQQPLEEIKQLQKLLNHPKELTKELSRFTYQQSLKLERDLKKQQIALKNLLNDPEELSDQLNPSSDSSDLSEQLQRLQASLQQMKPVPTAAVNKKNKKRAGGR